MRASRPAGGTTPTTSGTDGAPEPRAATTRSPAQVRALGLAITEWGTSGVGGTRRPALPWRSTRDPWAVLVSEVMTQQTQVDRVVPAYLAFLERFPTPADCSAAPLGEVVRAWRGLGYNRRARDLHAAARAMVDEHAGRVPDDLDALRSLPGVGAYTARAVLAFAFGRDIGVLDTNAGRVLARAAAGRPLKGREAQDLVDAMVPPGRGWDFGQALLDLGATVCTARAPGCRGCPVRRRCRWARLGGSEPDPSSRSAAVSRGQPAFRGSDREARGRLVDALRDHQIRLADVASVMGIADDPGRVRRVVDGLVADGLIVRCGGTFGLP
ncbi:MAG: A/G-specific adenine glycosylase [Acidimicrobiales bacterium]|nr:A/G-specific adenine glycosylase [Acidimicrobiales bacterium]